MFPGDHDIERAILELEGCLPEPLRSLARVAYDYRWSWTVDGAALFETLDCERWRRTGHNPRRLLTETPHAMLVRVRGWPGRFARRTRWCFVVPNLACMARCPSIPGGWACWQATS